MLLKAVWQRLAARIRRLFVWCCQSPVVILMFGPPGSGKGSTAVELARILNIGHLSTGDLFRREFAQDASLKERLAKGKLAPDDLTNSLVSRELCDKKFDRGCILDGYPRNLIQLRALLWMLRLFGARVTLVVFLDVPAPEIVTRLSNRRTCFGCGRSYNLISLKPRVENICDACGSALYQRSDDSKDAIEERLRVYDAETKPLIARFEKLGLLFGVPSGTPDQVLETVLNRVSSMQEWPRGHTC
jgi:adenylate kinase